MENTNDPTAPRKVPEGREHLYAEITSRYDLRCVKCGVRALYGREASHPCPVRDGDEEFYVHR